MYEETEDVHEREGDEEWEQQEEEEGDSKGDETSRGYVITVLLMREKETQR